MVEIADIVDRESLEAWLKDQPRAVSVWIAHRNAMRVLPLWWDYVLTPADSQKGDLTALPILRCNLISSVARTNAAAVYAAAVYAANAAAVYAANAAAANAANTAAVYAANAAAANAANTAAVYAANAAAANAANAAANAAAAFWKLLRVDCEAITSGADLDQLPLWRDQLNPLVETWGNVKRQLPAVHSDETARGSDAVDWSFWIKWYDDALSGIPPSWDMLERIALIDPKEWDKGAGVVNPLIAEIVAEYDARSNERKEFKATAVSPVARTAIAERVQQNREVLALSIAGVLEQISEFSERIHGINHLDAAYRENIFKYLEGLSGQLTDLLGQLPDENQMIEESQAEKLVTWGQQFRHSFIVEAKKYAAPNNVAGAAVPTGIILGCTMIGTFFGPAGALAGGVVGRLITGELKPSKAADALFEDDEPPKEE